MSDIISDPRQVDLEEAIAITRKEDMKKVLRLLKPHCKELIPVGSRVTCFPPPTDTDADYLGFVEPGGLHGVVAILESDGWDAGGSIDADIDRATLRKGDDNLILTTSQPFYDSFIACTAIAKRMNLLKKEDRVALFDECRKYWPGLKKSHVLDNFGLDEFHAI